VTRVVVTGAGGLVGSQVARHFAGLGLRVTGVDNDLRGELHGPAGSTRATVARLLDEVDGYQHESIDIRDPYALNTVIGSGGGASLVVHCAAQAAHESGDPTVDWDVNAVGTVNLLEAVRQFAPDAVVVVLSTIKVYGLAPNALPLVELATRYEYLPAFSDAVSQLGIDETMSIDGPHGLFGASKTVADLMAQEYGHSLGLRTAVLRPGCLTGPDHAGVRAHGFLAWLVRCVATGEPYQVEGSGKQVRDQLHVADVVSAVDAIWRDPPGPGSVFNLGGGRGSDVSVLEALALAEEATGRRAALEHVPGRADDHRWWVTDTTRLRDRYGWKPTVGVREIVAELADRWRP